jgi:endo-1,4-beta-xylanase
MKLMSCALRGAGSQPARDSQSRRGSLLSPWAATWALLAGAGLAATAQAPTTLKDAFKGSFLIGAAVSAAITTGADDRDAAIVKAQFNSISPENELKWERIHPQPGSYNFELADRYVDFGEKNRMFIVGHNLVWHNQTPAWVFHDDKGNFVDRETLIERMHDHIRTVVGRYKGRIQSWDVVNEALNEDGTLRQSPWLKIIGPDYIAKAFQFAHEADPAAILNYNDYALENEAKRNGAIKLIRDLRAQGIPVSVVGMQGHLHLTWPSADVEDATIAAFAALGVKVAITELDIDALPPATRKQTADVSLSVEARAELNPYAAGLPDSVQDALTKRYASLFAVFLKHRDTVTRVTFWGVTDADSWLNNWPVRGRTSYPLLFDRSGQPKPAFDAVVREAIQ